MGKVSNRSSMVSTRRRLIKASSGVGVKKCRGSAKGSLPPPPPPQSLVLDEDSGFGGDQSLDSESSLLSSPGSSSGVASLPSVLPSLTMVPKAKLLLVSLLQGAGGVQGTGTSQKTSGNIAVGAYPPTTQASISNGTNQTGNTHGAVMSSGAENEGESSQSVWPLLAAASLSLQGAPGTDVLSELPAASTSSPSNCPTEPVTQIGHKEETVAVCNKAREDVAGQVNRANLAEDRPLKLEEEVRELKETIEEPAKNNKTHTMFNFSWS